MFDLLVEEGLVDVDACLQIDLWYGVVVSDANVSLQVIDLLIQVKANAVEGVEITSVAVAIITVIIVHTQP